jgi:hypothetical protein
MKNFLDIPDLPHGAFQPTKIGLRSRMSLHGGGGGQTTSHTSPYPEWAEPQVQDLFNRGNLASLQPYQQYELGGSYQTDVGYVAPDAALKARLATPEGLNAYVNEQTIGRGIKADLSPLEKASYAKTAGLNIPGMFQDSYSGYTPSSSQYEAEKQRYEDQTAFFGGLTDAQAQDIAFGAKRPTITSSSGQVFTEGDSGYAGADAQLNQYKTDSKAAYGAKLDTLRSGADSDAWVESLYGSVLNRASDAGGKKYWVDQINAGKSREEVLNDFLYTVKSHNIQVDPTTAQNLRSGADSDAWVESLYGSVLNRASDAGGKKYWLDRLNAGESRDKVLDSFLYAAEPANIQETLGASYDTARGSSRIGEADYDSSFTQQDLMNDIEVLRISEGMLNPGQEGYEGAKTLYDRAKAGGKIDEIKGKYSRAGGVNYIEGIAGLATREEGPLDQALSRLRSNVSNKDFGSKLNATGETIVDYGNEYTYGYQAPVVSPGVYKNPTAPSVGIPVPPTAAQSTAAQPTAAQPTLQGGAQPTLQGGAQKTDLAGLVAPTSTSMPGPFLYGVPTGPSGYAKPTDLASGYTAATDAGGYAKPTDLASGYTAATDAGGYADPTDIESGYTAATDAGGYKRPTDIESGYKAATDAGGYAAPTKDLLSGYTAATDAGGYAAPTKDLLSGYTTGTLADNYAARDLASAYTAGTLGNEAKYTADDTAIGDFTPEQMKALSNAGYSLSDIGLQDADAGYTARQMVGGEFDAAAAAKYMTPYQQGITDIALDSAEAEDLKYQNRLAAQAVQAGAFGGDRDAILDSERARNYQKLRSDIQTQGSQKAYEAAASQFEADRAARMQAQQLTEGFRQKAAELDQSYSQFDETSDQTAARIGLEGYAKEQAAQQAQQQLTSDAYANQESAKQTQQQLSADAFGRNELAKQAQQQLTSDAWKASQAAGQAAGAQEIDAYAREQAAKQAQQQLTSDAWKSTQAAGQAAGAQDIDAYAREQAAAQTQQQLTSDAWKASQAAGQAAGAQEIDAYAREQAAAQTQQQLTSDAWKASQAAGQAAGAQDIDAYAREQAAAQTQQQLTSDAWKASQAAGQAAGAQEIDAYAREQAAAQTQQQLTSDAWKASQAAGQAAGAQEIEAWKAKESAAQAAGAQSLEAYKAEQAAKQAGAQGQLEADKLSEESGQFAAINALNRAKTENELFVSQAQLEMASSKLDMEQIELGNKLGGQQRGFTQQQLDLLQNENFASQGFDQQQLAWLGALFSGSLMPTTGQQADSGQSGINSLLGAVGTIGSLVT